MNPLPVDVLGLKKSGKTTVTEAIVAQLRSWGYSVGTIKSMVHSTFSLDVKGKDTYRHSRAGADFVVSLSMGETVYIERHEGERRGLNDIERLLPEGAQFVVSEGSEDLSGGHLQICCLRSLYDMGETLKVRGIDEGSLMAVSGIVASTGVRHPYLPTFDILDPGERAALARLIIEKSGDVKPSGIPGGPLLTDPGWRPGVMPPGEFPEVPEANERGWS